MCIRDRLTAELPEVDKIYGKYDWKQLITDLGPALSADSATPLSYRTTPPSVKMCIRDRYSTGRANLE